MGTLPAVGAGGWGGHWDPPGSGGQGAGIGHGATGLPTAGALTDCQAQPLRVHGTCTPCCSPPIRATRQQVSG